MKRPTFYPPRKATVWNRPQVLIIALLFLTVGGVMGGDLIKPQDASAQATGTLLSISRDDDLLREVNPLTGATISSVPMTLVGQTGTGANGLAQDPTTGLIWAILKLQSVNGRVLVTVDPLTGVATSIGNTGDTFAGITFDSAGTLYGVTGDGASTSETLFTLNKTNATPTLLVALGNGDDGETIAFNPDDSLIYHASGLNSPIFETVNPSTTTITNIPLTGDSRDEIAGIMYEGNGTFLVVDLSDELFRITTAGVVTDLGITLDFAVARGFVSFTPPLAVGGLTRFINEPGVVIEQAATISPATYRWVGLVFLLGALIAGGAALVISKRR